MGNEKDVVLITGACGLLGTAITRRLSERYRVVGFDIVDSPPPVPFSAYHKVDLTSDESVDKGLDCLRRDFGERIASVIHLAAYYSFSGEPSPLYEKVTIRGTERLLKKLQEFAVEQFVFSSTMLVHAPSPQPGDKIDEESPLEPKWDYPRSKSETEEIIWREHGDIPFVLARIAGVYDSRCHSIPIAHQIQRIYEEQMTGRVYPGDLSKGQAFVHLEDLTEAIFRLIERRKQLPPEEVLLIGEDKTLGYGDLQEKLGELIHGKKWQTRKIPKPVAKTGAWVEEKIPGHDPFIKPWMVDLADDHYELDISRARKALGWEPKHSLEETLHEMIAALKEDPVGWYKENKLEMPGKLKRKAG